MLTKNDLQHIGELLDKKLKAERVEARRVIREEIEIEAQRTRKELQAEIKLTKIEISNRLDKVEGRLKSVEIKTSRIQKDVDRIIPFFDKDIITLRKRVTKIEQHLHLEAL